MRVSCFLWTAKWRAVIRFCFVLALISIPSSKRKSAAKIDPCSTNACGEVYPRPEPIKLPSLTFAWISSHETWKFTYGDNVVMVAYFIATLQSLALNNLPPRAVIPIICFFFLDGSLATVIYFATLQTMSYWTHVVFMVRYAGICGFHLWFWFSVLGMSANLAVSLFQSYKILISVQNMRDIWRFHSFWIMVLVNHSLTSI